MYSCHAPLGASHVTQLSNRDKRYCGYSLVDFSDHIKATTVTKVEVCPLWVIKLIMAPQYFFLAAYFGIGGAQCENYNTL